MRQDDLWWWVAGDGRWVMGGAAGVGCCLMRQVLILQSLYCNFDMVLIPSVIVSGMCSTSTLAKLGTIMRPLVSVLPVLHTLTTRPRFAQNCELWNLP